MGQVPVEYQWMLHLVVVVHWRMCLVAVVQRWTRLVAELVKLMVWDLLSATYQYLAFVRLKLKNLLNCFEFWRDDLYSSVLTLDISFSSAKCLEIQDYLVMSKGAARCNCWSHLKLCLLNIFRP